MFTYHQLLEDIEFLKFKGVETGSIGKSELGFDIPYLFLGSKNAPKIIISGGIHARENVSALVVMRQVYHLAKNIKSLSGGVYFVPLINVDGCLLIEKGADFVENRRDFLIKTNGGNSDFSLWKANINAVDLNTNFDARFGSGLSNKTYPAPSDYIGTAPFDQAETRALRDFTLDIKPALTVSYHALGRELYWYFHQTDNKARDEKIAESVNGILSYKKIDSSLGSAGGYKDWCIEKLSIPSLTIELGREGLTHPLSMSDIESDWEKNRDLPSKLLEILDSHL